MSDETRPTLDEIEERIAVTPEEILDAISNIQPMLVQAVSENLQNQKMKAVLAEIYDGED